MSALSDRIASLSGREKALFAIALLAALPLALVFLVAQPLLEARDEALEVRTEAQALQRWVGERHGEWLAMQPAGPAEQNVGEPVGLAGVEAALRDAGLADAVEVLEDSGGGRVTLRLGDVVFLGLGSFLTEAESALGYKIGSARIRRSETPGNVTADIELEPRGS